ncbi:Transcription elongation factor SPT4 [Chamberlinius hualienensis]
MEVMTSVNEEDAFKEDPKPDDPPLSLDIVINNVVCSFNVRCHLDLRRIALTGANVEFRREQGMLTMKIRNPLATASMWSSGKVTCTGSTSEQGAKVAGRKFARALQKLGFKTRFTNYRVVNVLGTCSMPFNIRIGEFSKHNQPNASYEPELHPGVTYKIKDPKATLKIFSTGSITVTAPSVVNVQSAIEHIFPLVYEYRRDKIPGPVKIKKPLQSSWKRSKNYDSEDDESEMEEGNDRRGIDSLGSSDSDI